MSLTAIVIFAAGVFLAISFLVFWALIANAGRVQAAPGPVGDWRDEPRLTLVVEDQSDDPIDVAEEFHAKPYAICRTQWPAVNARHIHPHLCTVPVSVVDHDWHECLCGAGISAEVTV